MSFEDWMQKFVYSSRLHLDEDTAIDMYNAAYDFGYDEAAEDTKNLRSQVKKLKKTAEWCDAGDFGGVLDIIKEL